MKIKKTLLFIVYLLFVALLLEMGLRLFLVAKYQLSFFSPKIIYRYYPELKAVDALELTENDGVFDILLLGGSVLNRKWGSVETELCRQLRLSRKLRIHNLSQPAHSSLDSKIKYEWLRGKHFDFVMFYHGINEVRANNCPASVFRSDYTHYSWYQDVYRILRHKESKYTVIPYFVDLAVSTVKRKINGEKIVPKGTPLPEWVEEGKYIKTKPSFEKNILDIILRAKSAGDPILIMTFAYYLPVDYSLEKFKAKQLNYAYIKSSMEIEAWGKPENIREGLETHNQVIRGIANDFQTGKMNYAKFYYLDMDGLMSKTKNEFRDVCHLTPKGSEEFVSHIVPVIQMIS